MHFVYLLLNSKNKTYVGYTNNPERRIRQHNGIIKGGAKKTRHGAPWRMVLKIIGFKNKIEALQIEWMWQHPLKSKKTRGLIRQMKQKGKIGSYSRKLKELQIILSLFPTLKAKLM